MNCSMAFEESELDRNKVFGSASEQNRKEADQVWCKEYKLAYNTYSINT